MHTSINSWTGRAGIRPQSGRSLALLLLVGIALLTGHGRAWAGNGAITRYSFGGGGGVASLAGYPVVLSVGQSFGGATAPERDNSLINGFLPRLKWDADAEAVAGPPALAIQRSADGLVIIWDDPAYVLEQTDALDGREWVKTPGGEVSPVLIVPNAPQRFYRLNRID